MSPIARAKGSGSQPGLSVTNHFKPGEHCCHLPVCIDGDVYSGADRQVISRPLAYQPHFLTRRKLALRAVAVGADLIAADGAIASFSSNLFPSGWMLIARRS